MSAREIAEYEKALDLWDSEGRVAWELVSIYVAVQAGLASVFALLYNQYKSLTISLIILAGAGALSSFAWLFILYRARMRRENWFFLGLRMERQLFIDHRFHIFEVENAVRRDSCALKLSRCSHPREEIAFRDQRWYEKSGALRIAHLATPFVGVVWIVLPVIVFFLPNVL